MIRVNHLDDIKKVYPAEEFVKTDFIAYKIKYSTETSSIEIPCFNKRQLGNEMVKLFNRYMDSEDRLDVNVIGYRKNRGFSKYEY